MRKQRPRPMRNKLNLTDVRQVRLVKKRLGLSDTELAEIVGKIGNSLSAISAAAAHDLPSEHPAAEKPPTDTNARLGPYLSSTK